MTKFEFIQGVTDLESLSEEILSCDRCPLSHTRTNAVPGEGPKDARILLLGEAPGKDEDISGRPFVGRAGRVLDECLAAAEIDRSTVFITNVVKCRPPQNRRPKVGEMEACRPYLQAHLRLIEPGVVCLMGNVATKAVLGREGVTKLRGRVFDDLFLVTFHPSAVLRNRNLKSDLVRDLKKAKEVAESRGSTLIYAAK